MDTNSNSTLKIKSGTSARGKVDSHFSPEQLVLHLPLQESVKRNIYD